jgi:hypothetical protein
MLATNCGLCWLAIGGHILDRRQIDEKRRMVAGKEANAARHVVSTL